MLATPPAVLRSRNGRRCRQPAEACPVKLARTPCEASKLWRSVTNAGQALRRHRGVLDERRRALRARRAHEQRQYGAPQRGGVGQRVGVLQPDDLRCAERCRKRTQPSKPGVRLVVAALVLHREQSGVGPVEHCRQAAILREVGRAAQRREVEELHSRRPGVEDRDVGLEGGLQRGERERRAHATCRARVEQHLQLGEQRERALRAGQHAAQVGLRRRAVRAGCSRWCTVWSGESPWRWARGTARAPARGPPRASPPPAPAGRRRGHRRRRRRT